MTEQEKIHILEETMELDNGTLNLNDFLENYQEWDSITILAFIALMDERFHKRITGKEIKELKTVADAIAMME